jgi:hypothetical protein
LGEERRWLATSVNWWQAIFCSRRQFMEHFHEPIEITPGHPGSTPNAVSSRLFCRDANEINDLATR